MSLIRKRENPVDSWSGLNVYKTYMTPLIPNEIYLLYSPSSGFMFLLDTAITLLFLTITFLLAIRQYNLITLQLDQTFLEYTSLLRFFLNGAVGSGNSGFVSSVNDFQSFATSLCICSITIFNLDLLSTLQITTDN